MHRTRRIWVGLVLLALSGGTALAAGPQLSAEQQQAADKLKAKGGSVMQLAADSDALVVNLGLAGKAVGDDELALVKTLPKVVDLDLHGTGVTDAGLANIEGMKDLTRLRLDRTQVGDAGVAHLKDLSNLVYLNLYETPVTDAGLDSLKGLKNLKRLYLWQTKVTDAGADSLHKALPDVTVNRGEGMAALAAVKPAEEKKPDAKKPTDAKPDKKPDDKKPDAKTDDKKTASAGESKPDDDGFIRAWLILAPIPVTTPNAGATEVDHEFVAGEKELKPKAGDKAKAGDKELAWKTVKANDYQFDLNEIVGQPTEQSVAYAVVYVDPGDERKDLTLAIGSDDQAKVYLNGKQIIKTSDPRALAKDQDKAANLTLNKGTNVLVFKIVNEGGGWQGCARFTDKEGKPVKDIKLKLAP